MTFVLACPNNHHMTDSEIIDALGGTFKVAELCEVKPPSVSDWRITGIPNARRMYLRAIRPELSWPELVTTTDKQGA